MACTPGSPPVDRLQNIRQLNKLSIAETLACENAEDSLQRLASLLQSEAGS